MRLKHTYKYSPTDLLKEKILQWGKQFEYFVCLDTNHYWQKNSSKVSYHSYDCIIAAGSIKNIIVDSDSFETLKAFYENNKDWLFGYFSYDLKNEIESLSSKNEDYVHFPQLQFFIPEYVIKLDQGELCIESHHSNTNTIFNEILSQNITVPHNQSVKLEERFSKKEYIDTIRHILDHIQYGDIYEMNFCMEFFGEGVVLSPVDLYKKLLQISPTPFSCYMHMNGKYLISASPERFLKKVNDQLISQPIKGTMKRGKNTEEDKLLKEKLYNDDKERSENVMIVDLVRNDLSRTAQKSSVEVEELFGIYTFNQVHQMISTIRSKLHPDYHFIDAIKQAFPMGSMTGAPKIKAMELIEKYEKTKRGLYSGSVGFIKPNGDFDFNVVIRSLIYNEIEKYLSFHVGGAITIKSDPEKEYEECLLKAKAMLDTIN